MTVKRVLTLCYEGESGDDKPTGVIPGTTFRETDTYHLYKTFDGDTWVRADWGLLDNVAVLQHHIHSRMRVYPQDGERRLLLPTPVTKATEILEIIAAHCPANAKLWGRLKTASGNADEAEISVAIIRHQEITNPIDHLTTWPWST